MITVFTLCSANYLAHAKTLGDSLLEHNPDFYFVIGLVDRIPKELDPSYCQPFEVIPVEELGLPQFADMRQKYDIVELNTAVKPFYMAFLFERNPNVEAIIYLDPDILVYGSFAALLGKLNNNSMVLTPHSCSYEDSIPSIQREKRMLSNGIYNLGFIAVSRTPEIFTFLKWWQTRLQDHCHYRSGVAGMFYDQLWMNLAPLYFHGVYIETDPGYNMCHWNHFERLLAVRDDGYVVNDKHDLIFFHFSGYKPENPDVCVGRSITPFGSLDSRPDLRPIYDDYRKRLLARDYVSIKSIPWYFMPPPVSKNELAVKKFIKSFLKGGVDCMPNWFRNRLKRLALFTAKKCEREHKVVT